MRRRSSFFFTSNRTPTRSFSFSSSSSASSSTASSHSKIVNNQSKSANISFTLPANVVKSRGFFATTRSASRLSFLKPSSRSTTLLKTLRNGEGPRHSNLNNTAKRTRYYEARGEPEMRSPFLYYIVRPGIFSLAVGGSSMFAAIWARKHFDGWTYGMN